MRIDVAKLNLELAHKEALVRACAPAAITVCRRCGFIRLHALQVLFGENE
jgi:hypothetical protein